MEEREQKRFRTDEDAMRFVQEVTQGRALPPQIWLKLLANDPKLHVDDIKALAIADPRGIVRELTKSGAVWEAIIERQFGRDQLTVWKILRPETEALHILMGLRLREYLESSGYDIILQNYQIQIEVEHELHSYLVVTGEHRDLCMMGRMFHRIAPHFKRRDQNTRALYGASITEALIDLIHYGFRPVEEETREAAYMGACAFCGKEAADLPICSGCDSVAYCGEECQEAHWKETHHKEC